MQASHARFLWSTPLTRFLWLYAAMYAAFGVASPFLPAFVSARGVPPEQLGLLLSAGTAVRLLTAPLAGHLGDWLHALRLVLVVCTGLAAVVQQFWVSEKVEEARGIRLGSYCA